MDQMLALNGVRIPLPGETIFVVTPLRKVNKNGKVFASRKPTEVELVEIKVATVTIQPIYQTRGAHAGEEVVSYRGTGYPVDLERPFCEIHFSQGNFSWDKEDAELLLKTFQRRGLTQWYDGSIQYADTKEFVDFVPLAITAK